MPKSSEIRGVAQPRLLWDAWADGGSSGSSPRPRLKLAVRRRAAGATGSGNHSRRWVTTPLSSRTRRLGAARSLAPTVPSALAPLKSSAAVAPQLVTACSRGVAALSWSWWARQSVRARTIRRPLRRRRRPRPATAQPGSARRGWCGGASRVATSVRPRGRSPARSDLLTPPAMWTCSRAPCAT
jgi:hypothetical protein